MYEHPTLVLWDRICHCVVNGERVAALANRAPGGACQGGAGMHRHPNRASSCAVCRRAVVRRVWRRARAAFCCRGQMGRRRWAGCASVQRAAHAPRAGGRVHGQSIARGPVGHRMIRTRSAPCASCAAPRARQYRNSARARVCVSCAWVFVHQSMRTCAGRAGYRGRWRRPLVGAAGIAQHHKCTHALVCVTCVFYTHTQTHTNTAMIAFGCRR